MLIGNCDDCDYASCYSATNYSNIMSLLTVSTEILARCDNAVIYTKFYSLVDDAETVCILPCLQNPCVNGGSCVSLPTGSYICRCYGGFTGSLCESGKFKHLIMLLVYVCILLILQGHHRLS